MRAETRTLHVHIGHPKTASTWLQERVFPELDHLTVRLAPRSRLFRLPADAASEHRLMAGAMRRAPLVWNDLGDRMFAELLGDRATWLARSDDLLISDETIGRTARRPEALAAHLTAMAAKARDWGFTAMRVLVLVRRQDHWLASNYAQVSDRRPSAGQRDFEASIRRVLDPSQDRYGFGVLLDYHALVTALYAAFGREAVTVIPHKSLTQDRAGTLRALLAALDTPRATVGRIIDATATGRSNVRTDATGRWTIRPRRVSKGLGGRNLSLPRWMDPRREDAITLTPALSHAILTAYQSANTSLAQLTGLDLAAHGYLLAVV